MTICVYIYSSLAYIKEIKKKKKLQKFVLT